jgi:hypothetical protein
MLILVGRSFVNKIDLGSILLMSYHTEQIDASRHVAENSCEGRKTLGNVSNLIFD